MTATSQEKSALRSGAKFMRSCTDAEYDMYVVSVPNLLRMEEMIPWGAGPLPHV